MKSVLRPTLVRRVVLALLLACALAWVGVTTYMLLSWRAQMRTNPGLLQYGREFNAALALEDQPDRAAALIESGARIVNGLRAKAGALPGSLLFQLRAADGRELYATADVAGQALGGTTDRVIDVTVNGAPYWLYEGHSPRWAFWMAEPRIGTQSFLVLVANDLLMPFLVAFPCILIPVWIAVARGLKPLRALGARIANRSPGDLSPLHLAPKYAELEPLVAALDTLLAQLRSKVERERAFVQDAAHELRTPLAVIRTQAHVLARSPDPGERQEAARQLEQSIARTSHVVAQLLDLATIDADVAVRAVSIDIADLVRQHLALCAADAAARGIRLALEGPDMLRARLCVALFDAVLRNLLENAIKYADPDSEIVVTLRAQAGTLHLAVADRGPGIAPQERAQVFERFYRGANGVVRGAGLGLPIVREACRRMGGTVELKDNPAGSGCVFEVLVPLVGEQTA